MSQIGMMICLQGIQVLMVSGVSACDARPGPSTLQSSDVLPQKSHNRLPLYPASSTRLRECWFHPQPGLGEVRVGVSDPHVYFSTASGELIARSQDSGHMVWRQSIARESIGGRNMVIQNGVLVVSISYETVGIDTRTGHVLWRYRAPEDSLAQSPARPGYVVGNALDADSTTVYVPAWGETVSALNVRTGAVRWIWRTHSVLRSGVAGVRLHNDRVFVTAWHYRTPWGGASEPRLIALDRRTGQEIWQKRFPAYAAGAVVQGAPVIYQSLVFFAGTAGRLWAIDQATGKLHWNFGPPVTRSAGINQVELSDGILYHYGGDERLYAFNAMTGEIRWQSDIPAMPTKDLLVSPKNVYAIHGSTLYTYDRSTGKPMGHYPVLHTEDGIYSSAAAYANGRVFVTTSAGAQCFYE